MGDLNQLSFVKENSKIVSGPILEIGSKNYGNTPDFRSVFPNEEYVGVDMEYGHGVDVVLDFTSDLTVIKKSLKGKKFKTVICFSVLEHCKNPFKMSRNIMRILDKNGVLFVSVPFSWRIHGYPSDYWRFTPEGVKLLFPELNFEKHAGNISTNKIGESGQINHHMFRSELTIAKGIKLKRYNYLVGMFILLCRKLKILPSVFDYPYLSPPVMVNMIGKKKSD